MRREAALLGIVAEVSPAAAPQPLLVAADEGGLENGREVLRREGPHRDGLAVPRLSAARRAGSVLARSSAAIPSTSCESGVPANSAQ